MYNNTIYFIVNPSSSKLPLFNKVIIYNLFVIENNNTTTYPKL